MTDFDVIVAGGGSAGVAAAVGASQAGARTLLVERGPCLGGAATLRNVTTYCGLYTREDSTQVVFGVAEQVLTGLRQAGAVADPQKLTSVFVAFDPEQLKVVLDDVCMQAGVELLLHSQVVGAERDGDRITAVRLLDHSGVRTVTAGSFVDASGEADLAAHGGAEVRYGNDGWVQNGSLGVRFGGIPATAEVTREVVTTAIRAARATGRTLLSERSAITRLPISGDLITFLVDEAYDARDARDVTRAEVSARKQAQEYLQVIRSLPGCAGAYIASTGPELGTRESRHVVARTKLDFDHVKSARLGPHPVALGAWPVEFHLGPGKGSKWEFLDAPGYFGIPLDALRSNNTANLFAAGRVMDGDRLAGGSLRVMGTAFATGHAAGVAAAQAADGDLDPESVRKELNRQDARLPEGN
ncbi:FAD-dependent oxidoreductase [Labedaea rhizosphaerae]|uniref:FAD dependent oxidoreductase n=1 Tax=Labedaea rhizosphaerae TaxID=598644 RepID=A0A4R6S9R7_LABRH|nr:FAD-dependent oxidoreductase [Labedaea rhizosphaerae]TDP96640.1 FAD dependent oxidoreductase [Labedaea rhizosphaerae]